MKGYLLISDKSGVEEVDNDIRHILENYNGLNDLKIKKTKNSTENMVLYTFTNEPVLSEHTFGPHDFALSGNFLYEENKVFTDFINAENKNKYISNLGGIYTFATLNDQTFTAWNNVTRVEPIYWHQMDNRIVIGTKAMLVHLIGNQSKTPKYDTSSVISFLNNGFYADEKMPYKHLNVLDANHYIRIKNFEITIKETDTFMNELYSISPTNNTYDELTEAYLNSFLYLKRLGKTMSTGLTGGKDSRLIVAALNHLNIDFNAHTTGFETTPDVIIAQKIAKELGVEHKFNIPGSGKDVISLDLYARTVNAIKNTEGLLFSYENVANNKMIFKNESVALGGQGGENLRGGYARQRQFNDVESVKKFMINSFSRFRAFFEADPIKEYQGFIRDFITVESKNLSPNDILNHFYLKYRTGRWSGSSVPYYTAISHFFAPLFENQLVKKAHSINSNYGANDNLIYNILQRIAPELIDIPFANDRWNFEKNHPYHKYQIHDWIKRVPVQNTSQLSGFNWRRDILTSSNKQFREVIFSDENSPIFNIINKQKLKKLFDSPPANASYYDVFLWSLYTQSVLLSNEWYKKTDKKSRISLKVPSSTSREIEGVLKEINHIPNEHLKSNNENLTVQNIDDVTSIISWSLTDDSRLYFQLFDNNYATPPTLDKYGALTKVSEKKIKFIFEIEKIEPHDFNLQIYFIQYNNKERIKSTMKKVEIKDKYEMFTYELPLEKDAVQFKVAFQIVDMLNHGKFSINQMRVEYTT